ncbi:auxin response factor 17-like [Trifolium pratense]|uniref:auxin response factor 17-like n=1 Tax=Trifolium pratense TaxID=57577 RepID=UPI001E696CD5|nr:auxin response factor 17-like [Trifolium pratense]
MSQPQPCRVDPKLWQSCAGDSIKIPKLHSKVYYFPQGHLEHSNPSPSTQSLSLINGYRPFIPCIISAIDLLADPHTDEVFAKLLLTPVADGTIEPPDVPYEDQENNVQVVSSFKTLTRSDANNGGAFSVPCGCAIKIFPPLDLKAKPAPFQELSFTDVHGEVWKFRHIYTGTPQRHLITSGWSKFVDKKKLVVGDSLIFLKNSAGRIFIGIRRKFDISRSRRITEKAVTEAAELADKNKAFEVVYYPTARGDNFVVDANVVEDAMKINWNCGMRVKFPLNNDSSKGTISNLPAPSNRPWRMLQVNWDEPKVSGNTKRINPWMVEPIFDIAELNLHFPQIKRLRVDPGFALSRSTERESASTHNCKASKVSPSSIKLFGRIIKLSAGGNLPDSGINEDGCKGCNEVEAINKTMKITS